MDRHFGVPADPARLPDPIRIRSLDAKPYPDDRRLKCTLEITDFNTSPDAKSIIRDHEGHAVASRSIIGLANSIAVYTVLIREPARAINYNVMVCLTGPDEGLVDQEVIDFFDPSGIDSGVKAI